MAERTILKVVKFLADVLKERGLNVSEIILFGSQAKGTATEQSDIDLVVVSEDFRGKDIFERSDLLGDVEVQTIRKFMVPLDIITMSPEDLESETSLVADYAKQGKVVFPPQKQRRAIKQTTIK